MTKQPKSVNMHVKQITQVILFIILLWGLQLQAQRTTSWPDLAAYVRKELQQKYTDSITYYRPKCDSIRNLMHDLGLSTGEDNTYMFGSNLKYIKEGLSKEFLQKPQVSEAFLKQAGLSKTMAEITVSHVRLFDLDVYLSYWVDAKMVLDHLSKQDLARILESDFGRLYEKAKQITTPEAQRKWALENTQKYIDDELKNSPYFWAFKGEGHLQNDIYAQNLQRYRPQQPAAKKQTTRWIQQFHWILPPVLDSIREFSLSSANGDTLVMVHNGKNNGVVDKQGNVIIPFSYSQINFLPAYWIEASNKQKSFWYTRKGETFLQEYESAFPHVNGYAIVYKAKKWGLVNAQGKLEIPLIYDRYRINHQGKYIFYQTQDSVTYTPLVQNLTTSIPDANRPPVIPQRVLGLKTDRVQIFDRYRGWYLVQKARLFGLVDSLGKEILPIEYQELARKGSDLIYLYKKNRIGGYWIISKNIKVEPKYNYLNPVGDSSMLAIVGNGKDFGILDIEKENLIFPYSNYFITYYKPYFALRIKNDSSSVWYVNLNAKRQNCALLNEKGQMIEKPDSVDIQPYSDGSYLIVPDLNEKSTPYPVLKSPDGKVLRQFKDQYVNNDGVWIRYYDQSYQVKWVNHHHYRESDACEVDGIGEELYTIKKDGLWGFTDLKGQVVFPPGFSAVKPSKNGWICVKVNGKWGILKNPLYKGSRR